MEAVSSPILKERERFASSDCVFNNSSSALWRSSISVLVPYQRTMFPEAPRRGTHRAKNQRSTCGIMGPGRIFYSAYLRRRKTEIQGAPGRGATPTVPFDLPANPSERVSRRFECAGG